MRPAFVFDPDRCTGCQACELACSIENDLGPTRTWREVITFNSDAIPGISRFHLSLACNHCAEPACMHSCPALAYSSDPATGAVLIEADKCIGCRYCSWACPYGAPRYEPERGVMGKCTFCQHRLEDGLKPACATLCPTGALDFTELPASRLGGDVDGFPQTPLGPSIRIESPGHRDSLEPEAPRLALAHREPPDRTAISLRREWSLAAFTFLVASLFALLAGSVGGTIGVRPGVFALVAVLAGALSLSHLGRPGRAWRAALNLRRSWLSREVVAFGAFVFGGTWLLAASEPGTAGGAIVFAAGLATLVSADMVYRPVHRGLHPVLDGGGSLLTGLYLAGWLAGDLWLAGAAGLLKLAAELHGNLRPRPDRGAPGRYLLVPRILLGLVVPAAAAITAGLPLPAWALGCMFVGEALARAGYYLRL
ncbi:MAG: 4Fe-4S binding protein, partial [marine benthic group bacterium]|nr:4Fe-4S binding protein [Candidatus Benthicola marisminoris]